MNLTPSQAPVKLNLRLQAGFTLIEVFIAMMVLLVALLGMAGMAGTVIQTNLLSRQVTTATSLAEEKIEEMLNTLSADGNDIISVGGNDFTREWVVENNTPLNGLTRVTVTVDFSWRGIEREVELQTIVR